MHPRGRAALDAAGLGAHPRLHVAPPLGYLEFVALVKGARAVITDSGGVQEETTLLRVPSLTLETEHRAAHHRDQRKRPPGHPVRAGQRGIKACDDGPYAGELPRLWGQPGRAAGSPAHHHRMAEPGGPMREPKGRGVAWTEERGTSDEGRQCP